MITGRWLYLVIFLAALRTAAGRAQDGPEFRFSAPVETDSRDTEELFSVPFASDVYAATRDGFPDVRVLDSDDQLVPFLIRRVTEARTELVRRSWTVSNPSLKPQPANGLEIRVTLKPEDPQPTGIRIVTPLDNFEQEIRVFATVNGSETTLVDGTFIFDYSRFMDVRRTEISFPASAARDFRILVAALTSDQESQLQELTRSIQSDSAVSRTERTTIERRPFRIDRIEFWSEQTEQRLGADRIQPWPVTDLQVTQDEEHNQTVAAFRTQRAPLTSLKIRTPTRNFNRGVLVQVPADDQKAEQWRTIAESTISNFLLRDVHEEHLTISLPESRTDQMRVVIANGDSRELTIDGIEASGYQDEVVFLRPPNVDCRLVYGSLTTAPAQHDTAPVSTALTRGIRPVAARLGPQSARQSSPQSEPGGVRDLLNNPIVLTGLVGILVLGLGWGLFQASRRIDRMPPEDVA
jgi:hypothetical protein